MSSKKTLKENSNLLSTKKLLIILASAAIGIFLFIFSFLNSIQDSQILVSPNNSLNQEQIEEFSLPEDHHTVTISNTSGQHKFKVALATDEKTRQKGLMGVRSMQENEGMLFVFPEETQLSFWMKNTYIPLDLIFIDNNNIIVTIHENAKPLDITKRYESATLAKYVLEVNGGTSGEKGIKVGDRIEISPELE